LRWPLLCSGCLRRSSLRGEETADPSFRFASVGMTKERVAVKEGRLAKERGSSALPLSFGNHPLLWQPPSPLATTLSFGNHPLLWQPPSPLATTLSFKQPSPFCHPDRSEP